MGEARAPSESELRAPSSETESETEIESRAPSSETESETEIESRAPSSETGSEDSSNDARSSEPATQPVIELEDVSVAVAGKTLLEGLSLTVRRGERVLLVGPSGAGKSVLLRLLTGLLPLGGDYLVQGRVRVAGADLLAGGAELRQARSQVGIVFQDHALLDELSVAGNLAFARDHANSPGAGEAAERAVGFLGEHKIDPQRRVGTLSGGQKQRVAIARALARDPAVLFYDEPTSALDPRSARDVARLIGEAGEAFGKTSVVVTHDYPPFEQVVTRVLFLDPARRTLREIPWSELDATMRGVAPPDAPAGPAPAPLLTRALGSARETILDAVAGTPRLLLNGLKALPYTVLPLGARPRWLGRWLLHYARLTFLGSALPYNVIAGVIAGFVATYFTYKFLPRPELTEALILDDILPALGFALYRIVVPVLVTILLAGRTGAALASDFGNRVYHHQTDAMRSLGAPPAVYLGTSAFWASLVGVLVVGAVAFWSATLTSLSVFVAIKPDLTPFYWSAQFWRRLEPFQFGLIGTGWHWVLTKLLCSGAGVCAIAYAIGTRPKRTTADVSRGITLSVYWGTVFVLLVHFVCAFFEFQRPIG